MRTSRRGLRRRVRHARSTGSPPVRNERRSVRRRSGAPRREALAAARRGAAGSENGTCSISAASCASSSGEQLREALLPEHLDRARERRGSTSCVPGAVTRTSVRRAPGVDLAEEGREHAVVDGDVVAAARRAWRGRPSRGRPGESSAAARQKSAIRPVPTGRPSSRSARPKRGQRSRRVASAHAGELGQLGLDAAQVVAVLDRPAERLARRRRRPPTSAPRSESACAQSIASAAPGSFTRSSSRSRATVSATERASCSETPGRAQADDLHLALERRGSRSSGRGSAA